MNEPKIKIRNAVAADVPLILSLINELAEYEKLLDEVTTNETNLKEVLFGEHKYAEVIIAEYENQPAGQAIFFHNFSTFKASPGIYLEDLYVRPVFRGKGIGKKLLEEVISIAKQRKCKRVEWVVLDWNKSAIDFYKSLDAKPMNDWIVFRLTEDKF
ncbi:MAG: GNAT family N-acetyltransferase [Ignavibacteriales bacterium]|nr:MAG: GNAT family N-acetyltransferase [Ignavibacteriales bacterium]